MGMYRGWTELEIERSKELVRKYQVRAGGKCLRKIRLRKKQAAAIAALIVGRYRLLCGRPGRHVVVTKAN